LAAGQEKGKAKPKPRPHTAAHKKTTGR